MYWGRLLLYLLMLAGASLACFAVPPNVVVITLDTTRADRMGFLGSQGGLTPNLDVMARQSVVFPRAYAHVPLTTPSHASIFTGTYPQYNHVSDLGVPLAKNVPYLPDILHGHGYRTGAFVGALILDAKSLSAPGFDRGFDTYDAGFHKRGRGEDRYQSVERRAGEVVDRALAWLSQRPQGPFFLWVHVYDAHDPYDPPEPYKTKYASAPYDGEIAYTDSAIGRLLAALRSRGLYDGALIAVMADHGEAFGEHGERRHGILLYDETIRVPLLIKFPGERSAGVRVNGRVRLVDVAPTILQEARLQIPGAMQGESLQGLIIPKANEARGAGKPDGKASPDRPAYAETDYAQRAFGWSPLHAWRAGKYLYVQAPKRELYDQSADPLALHNLATATSAVADTLAAQLETFHLKTSSTATASAQIDPAQAENLRALGYLASDANARASANDTGADPKDKVEIANLLHDALTDMGDERYQDAVPKLEQVLKDEPNSPAAYLELGRAWVHLKNYQKAVPLLQQAVKITPESGMAHFELGLALVKTGAWQAAAPEFEASIAQAPNSPEMHFYLGAVCARLKRVPEATKEFETTLQLDSDHYEANLRFGRLLFFEGNPTAALPKLQKAAKLQPESREAHMFLADAYSELGQEQNAERERAAGERAKAPAKP